MTIESIVIKEVNIVSECDFKALVRVCGEVGFAYKPYIPLNTETLA